MSERSLLWKSGTKTTLVLLLLFPDEYFYTTHLNTYHNIKVLTAEHKQEVEKLIKNNNKNSNKVNSNQYLKCEKSTTSSQCCSPKYKQSQLKRDFILTVRKLSISCHIIFINQIQLKNSRHYCIHTLIKSLFK